MYTCMLAVGIRLCRRSVLVSLLNKNTTSPVTDSTVFLFCSSECFCGNTIADDVVKLPDPQCNYKCSGDPKQICGGYFTISIYETGIRSELRIESSKQSWNITFLFFLEFNPPAANLVPKPNDTKAKIVFLLTLNGRAVRQVYRLLKLLYSDEHYYYIHVDSVSINVIVSLDFAINL